MLVLSPSVVGNRRRPQSINAWSIPMLDEFFTVPGFRPVTRCRTHNLLGRAELFRMSGQSSPTHLQCVSTSHQWHLVDAAMTFATDTFYMDAVTN